jgi:ribosomal protein S18 acetylase RimI-like enzyme
MRSMATLDRLEIQPLTPDRFADLAALFELGGDPKWCWCTSFRVRGRDFRNSTPAGNKVELERMAGDDPAAGLIAYRDGVAIGWVSLGPRDSFERLATSRVLAPVDDAPVWSIVCFVVSRHARRQGVATALLDAAIAYATSHGATMLEAYPVQNHGLRLPSANTYMGTLAMYERAGFEVVARRQANAATVVRPIVRRTVEPD